MSKEYVFDNNAKQIRLVYVAIEKVYKDQEKQVKKTYNTSDVFALPDNIDIEKTCELISYLNDKICKDNNLESHSLKSVELVSQELKKYGFKKVENKEPISYRSTETYFPVIKMNPEFCNKVEGCIDLFIVNGDPNLFRRSNLKSRYFEWYSENVKESEINKLLRKTGR